MMMHEPTPRETPRSDTSLLAALIGRGRPAFARADALLERFGGLRNLAEAGARALELEGEIRPPAARRLAAAFELGRRGALYATARRLPMRSAADVERYLGPRIRGLRHEEVWVLSLDGTSALSGARCVGRGGLHGCSVAARDILRVALLDAASAIVLAHNHPSGDPTPSPEDVAMTDAVAVAADAVGIALVDHVVIGATSYASLLEGGALGEGRAP